MKMNGVCELDDSIKNRVLSYFLKPPKKTGQTSIHNLFQTQATQREVQFDVHTLQDFDCLATPATNQAHLDH